MMKPGRELDALKVVGVDLSSESLGDSPKS